MSHSQRRPVLYYGWIIATALAITQMTSWGVLYYAFSILLKPSQQELKWDTGTVTGAFSFAILVSGIAAMPVGRWLDRYGARRIMTLGSCASTILVIAWSQVITPVSFYIIWGLIGLTMAMTLYEPAFAVIARWFTHKRSWALTLVTLGGGLASVVYVPLTAWLVTQCGWRSTLAILAGILALLTIPFHAFVLRHGSSNLMILPGGNGSELSSPVQMAVRTRAFWYLTAAYSLSGFVFVAITLFLVPYLAERGCSTAFAASALGLLGGSQIPGRLLFAPLGSRLSRRWLMASIFGVQLVAICILVTISMEASVLLFAGLFGASAGAGSPARAVWLVEIYGSAHYGSISGVQALVITLAKSIAQVGLGILSAAVQCYQPLPCLLCLVAGGALFAILKVPGETPVGSA
jgi:MFS family permease